MNVVEKFLCLSKIFSIIPIIKRVKRGRFNNMP